MRRAPTPLTPKALFFWPHCDATLRACERIPPPRLGSVDLIATPLAGVVPALLRDQISRENRVAQQRGNHWDKPRGDCFTHSPCRNSRRGASGHTFCGLAALLIRGRRVFACVVRTTGRTTLFSTIDTARHIVSTQLCATTDRIIRFGMSVIAGTSVSSGTTDTGCSENFCCNEDAGREEGTGCANGINCSEMRSGSDCDERLTKRERAWRPERPSRYECGVT